MAVNTTFDIQINYTGDPRYLGAFQAAADRWEQIITADLPDVTSAQYGFVDDLRIDASVISIDGAGGILGQAGPDALRGGSSHLAYHGIMQFDSADVAAMFNNGTLTAVIMHEMGHVLGIGTLWDDPSYNLIDPNTHRYFGAHALAEYRALTGNASATYIPIEDQGGPGTANGHWDEETFNAELMTGYAESPGTPMPISRMTIASLWDLGYSVNLNAADPYTLPGGVNHPPVITSNGGGATATISMAENGTVATTVTASDPDGNALSYAVIGGADQQRFQISSTGVLTFVTAPDFESPSDSDANNSYVVQVQVSDGSLVDTQTITVTITDVAPVITGTGSDNVLVGTFENDTISGLAGNDTLTGNGGNDVLDGGDGTDTAVYANRAGMYSVVQSGTNMLVTGPGEGTDTVRDTVENYQFADVTFTRAQLIAELTPPTFTTGVDTVMLGRFGGTFSALGGDDVLDYRGGFATIDGGAGTDLVDFSYFASAVWVSLDYAGPDAWTMDRTMLSGGAWRAIADIGNVENLAGSVYDDFLQGNAGANTFFYAGGLDTVDGGAGTDTIDFSRIGSAVWVDLTYGGREAWTTDSLNLQTGTWRELADLVNVENVVGTVGADLLYGDANANRLDGGSGDDTLVGRGGDDILDGGNGTDTAVFASRIETYNVSQSGTDILVNGPAVGTDTVRDTVERYQFADGTLTRAQLIAELAAPTFTVGTDTVLLSRFGGSFSALGGDDVVDYRGGVVVVDGGAGTDLLDFSFYWSAVWVSLDYAGLDAWTMDRPTLSGGAWRSIADTSNIENLAGTSFDDFLQGNAGNNTFFYTGGLDTVDGGAGVDTMDFSRIGSAVWVDLAYGGREAWTTDSVNLGTGTWREIADLAGIENVTGTAAADQLYGDANANRLDGGAGDDTLTGRGGNDVLDGGNGTDTAVFAGRIETYSVTQSGTDLLVTGANEGTDTVRDTVERYQFTDGTLTRAQLIADLAAPTFTGSADSVMLSHFGGTFSALGGDDVLNYRGGFATVDGGTGTDLMDFSNYGSAVWVSLDYAGPDAWTMDMPTLSGGAWRAIADVTNVENLAGTVFDDFLQGNAGNNTFFYAGGLDTVDGGAGVDTMDFSRIGSAVWVDLTYPGREAWTTDSANLQTGTWRELADLSNVENVVGTVGADALYGDANNNRLEGGFGDDYLFGRGGNDDLVGGGGADRFVFGGAFGADRVADFNGAQGDRVDLSALHLANYAAVVAAAHDSGADVVIQFGADQITLAGLHVSDLQNGWFIL